MSTHSSNLKSHRCKFNLHLCKHHIHCHRHSKRFDRYCDVVHSHVDTMTTSSIESKEDAIDQHVYVEWFVNLTKRLKSTYVSIVWLTNSLIQCVRNEHLSYLKNVFHFFIWRELYVVISHSSFLVAHTLRIVDEYWQRSSSKVRCRTLRLINRWSQRRHHLRLFFHLSLSFWSQSAKRQWWKLDYQACKFWFAWEVAKWDLSLSSKTKLNERVDKTKQWRFHDSR